MMSWYNHTFFKNLPGKVFELLYDSSADGMLGTARYLQPQMNEWGSVQVILTTERRARICKNHRAACLAPSLL